MEIYLQAYLQAYLDKNKTHYKNVVCFTFEKSISSGKLDFFNKSSLHIIDIYTLQCHEYL